MKNIMKSDFKPWLFSYSVAIAAVLIQMTT